MGGLLLTVAARPICAQPSFTGIGTLDGVGSSLVEYVSSDGAVVVGKSNVTAWYPYEVVSWSRKDGMVSLTPGVYSSDPGGSNGTGSVLAGNYIHAQQRTTEAFWWTPDRGAVAMGDLPGGDFFSAVRGVSARGDILVGYSSSERSTEGHVEGFIWTEETGMVDLGDLPDYAIDSGARCVSVDGRVIAGGMVFDQGNEAIRWTEEDGMVRLGDFPGGNHSSGSVAISADGSVIVGNGFDADGQRAFRWTEETGMVALPKVHPNQFVQRAYGASWDGNVIVGEAAASGGGGAGPFYWTAKDGIRWLADVFDEHGVIVPDGWVELVPRAVSADGRTIVGYGVNPQGNTEGFVAYLGPTCRADFDDNGTVDAEDVAAYISAWLESNIFADWNYDGFINTKDFLTFLNEWNAKPGCE